MGLGDLHPLVRMVSLASAPLVVMALLTARALSSTFVMDPACYVGNFCFTDMYCATLAAGKLTFGGGITSTLAI